MWIVFATFMMSFLALMFLLKTNLAKIAVDQPNDRSLHTVAIPRTGGLALMLGILLGFMMLGGLWIWQWFLAGLILISLLDDVFGLSVKWRLLVQLLLCAGFIWQLLPMQSIWILIALTLALVWMTNLYNFMDGSDGLAGGMAVFGFGAYSVAAYLGGNEHLAVMCAVIAAASLAFLIYNFNPAKIFMGDAGSIPLGFLVGTIGIYGWLQQDWTYWFPLMVFSPFIVDATVTLFRRGLKREKIWQAHRQHYYQRLVQAGWGHRNVALAEYVLMVVCSGSSLWILRQDGYSEVFFLIFWSLLYMVLMLSIDLYWVRHARIAH